MRSRRAVRCLALVASLMGLACSDAGTPTEPVGSTGPQLGALEAQASVASARHEELKQQLEERKAYFKQMKEANRENLKAAKAEWKAWKEDWKEQYKLEKEAWKRQHPGQKGGPEIQLLRCEPRDYDAEAAIIGPAGRLHQGRRARAGDPEGRARPGRADRRRGSDFAARGRDLRAARPPVP